MAAESTTDPIIGSLLDGRYQIVQMLGKGGMGNVYLAEETRLRRRCAIKVLHPGFADDRIYVERFLREAQTIAQFEHRNIVDIYSYGEEPSGLVFFAMELLNGEDLEVRTRTRGRRPFTSHDCCLWGVQIARAMAVVHDAGLIHRDLKASNIFLAKRRDGEEVVKLLDFGIARPEEGSELTATGVALGTPSYMSPEQVRNVVVDRRSDIYSLGVLLFKLLTGKLPFPGDAIQTAIGHCLTPVPRPSEVAPDAGISATLDAIVMRAMAKEPNERQASMRELEEALAAVLRDEAPTLAATVERVPTTLPPTPTPTPTPVPMSTPMPVPMQVEPGTKRVAAGPETLPSQLLEDAGPATSAGQRTGPTTAMAVGEPRRGARRWLFVGGATLLGAALLFTVKALGGPEAPAPASEAIVVATPQSGSTQTPAPPIVETPAATPTMIEDAGAATKPGEDPGATRRVEDPNTATKPGEDPGATKPVDDPGVATKPVETPDAAPQVERTPAAPVVVPRKKAEPAPTDPFKQIDRLASQCRRKFKAVDGPKITIDYAVGIDGKVTRSIASVADPLGQCLADAVQRTQFPPKVVLGKKLAL